MFEKQISIFNNLLKGKRFQFLVKFMHDIFIGWSKAKILDLNEHYIKEVFYQEGDCVYDIHNDAHSFYIVRDGELLHETILEYETTVKFPADTHSWELDQTTKTLQYHIRNIHQGEFFGHEEILTELKPRGFRGRIETELPLRRSRVRALTKLKLLRINI